MAGEPAGETMGSGPLAQLAAPPVFVVGLHRSGTTWVYDMLTAHPQVAGVFESAMFSRGLGVGSLFHPEHWYPDAQALDRHRALFGSAFRLNQLMEREELCRDVRELTASWFERALQPEHRFLVEKTPQHFHAMRLIDELYPGAAFVHVIRDGRDVTVSLEEAGRSWPVPRVRATSRKRMAQRWVEGIGVARRHAREGRLRYVEVLYEELQRDPAARLSDLFAFCEIPADRGLVDRICTDTAFNSRRSGDSDTFRRSGVVGEWKQRFGLRQRFAFDRVAGELLVELGYEDDRRWWLPRPWHRARDGRAADRLNPLDADHGAAQADRASRGSGSLPRDGSG